MEGGQLAKRKGKGGSEKLFAVDWRRLENSPARDHEFHKLELPRLRSAACSSCSARPGAVSQTSYCGIVRNEVDG